MGATRGGWKSQSNIGNVETCGFCVGKSLLEGNCDFSRLYMAITLGNYLLIASHGAHENRRLLDKVLLVLLVKCPAREHHDTCNSVSSVLCMKVLIIIVLIADMQMAINPACKDSWDTLQLEILQHLLLKDMPVLPKYAKYLACQADKFRCLSVVAPFMSMTVFPRGAEPVVRCWE